MLAKNYPTRADLELAVQKLTPAERETETIRGTAAELKRLFLSSYTLVYEVPCIEIDDKDQEVPKSTEIKEKPPRGEKHDFGINGNLVNAPE